MELIAAVLLLVLGLGLMWAMQGLGKGLMRSARSKERARVQARRNLVQGTQLLARSRPREAAIEADKAISIDPKNAAAHILKAFAAERQGHKAAALRSLNTALSPPAVKGLSIPERAEALVKRAEVALAASSGGKWRLEFALKDLHTSVAINPNSAKAHCLLGRCYERKGLHSEARQAFQDAVEVDPSSHEANEGLFRLSWSHP